MLLMGLQSSKEKVGQLWLNFDLGETSHREISHLVSPVVVRCLTRGQLTRKAKPPHYCSRFVNRYPPSSVHTRRAAWLTAAPGRLAGNVPRPGGVYLLNRTRGFAGVRPGGEA